MDKINKKRKKPQCCSFCGQNEASIILCNNTLVSLAESSNKPLCLLHYYTTRACRSNITIKPSKNNNSKIRISGDGSELQKQKIKMQQMFMQAYDELRNEITEESVRQPSSSSSSFRSKMGRHSPQPSINNNDPLSMLFDAPRSRIQQPQRRRPIQQQQQQQQERIKRQRPLKTAGSMASIVKKTTTVNGSNHKIHGSRIKTPMAKASTAASAATPSHAKFAATKRRSPAPSPPPPPVTVPQQRRQQRPQQPNTQIYQHPKYSKPKNVNSNSNNNNNSMSLENEGGFIRTIALPEKLLQHQKRQQQEIAKQQEVLYNTMEEEEEDQVIMYNQYQYQQLQHELNKKNPYKRRKTTTKSIWNLALDNDPQSKINSNNILIDLSKEDEEGNSILKPSIPCQGCKSDNVVYDGNMQSCNNDVAKAETWGNKDRSDVVMMRCRCLRCGMVWNEDE